MMDIAMRDALTKEQLVVYVYMQVITFVKSFLVYVRWDQVWGAGGHSKGQAFSYCKFPITRHNALQYHYAPKHFHMALQTLPYWNDAPIVIDQVTTFDVAPEDEFVDAFRRLQVNTRFNNGHLP